MANVMPMKPEAVSHGETTKEELAADFATHPPQLTAICEGFKESRFQWLKGSRDWRRVIPASL